MCSAGGVVVVVQVGVDWAGKSYDKRRLATWEPFYEIPTASAAALAAAAVVFVVAHVLWQQ